MIVECRACHRDNRVPARRLSDRAVCGHCKQALETASRPLAIRSPSDFDELIGESTLPVLVDFWAEWCGPCRVVAPELEKLALESSRIVIGKLDTDALPTVAARFEITGIPTLVLFEHGREQKRVSGAMPAPAIAKAFGLS